jgi:membrane-associated phospholipid phosphatase
MTGFTQQQRSTSKTKAGKYVLAAVIVLVLLVLNIYVVKSLSIFVSPVLFLLAIFLEVALLGVLVYTLIRALAEPETVLRSLLISVWGGLESNEYVKRIRESRSPVVTWTLRRLAPRRPSGLALTATVMVAAVPLFSFAGLLLSVSNRGLLTGVDQRIMNLVPVVRSDGETSFFSTVTVLANGQSVLLLTAGAVTVLWWKHQRAVAALFLAAAAGQEALTFGIKHLVGRLRPDAALSLIGEDTYSFPSGHAVRATVLFGLLAYLLLKTYRPAPARAVTVALYVLAVVLVAVSRVYLGVHYPTDVWAGILLGSSMLVLLIGFLETGSRLGLARSGKIRLENRVLLAVPAAVLTFAVLASSLLIQPRTPVVQPSYARLSTLDESTVHILPTYSETLTGGRMEPISFIYVGSEDQVINTFTSHGWTRADPSTLANTLRALAVGFQGSQYPSAPVTPSFLNSQPESLAFQQATATQSLRQRHHTRLWRSGYALPDGGPVWVATASFDDGIEFAGPAKLPTHHIDPDIDAERSYIISSLGYPLRLLTVTHPEGGQNASGDTFFTDGKAEVIDLR